MESTNGMFTKRLLPYSLVFPDIIMDKFALNVKLCPLFPPRDQSGLTSQMARHAEVAYWPLGDFVMTLIELK